MFLVFAHEIETCTITNSPKPAVINLDKNASGGDGTWKVELRGPSPAQLPVTDDGTIDFTTPGTFATSGPTPAGVYVLTELPGAGAFHVGGWSCVVVGGGPPSEVSGASETSTWMGSGLKKSNAKGVACGKLIGVFRGRDQAGYSAGSTREPARSVQNRATAAGRCRAFHPRVS